ncbi:MAG: flagellar protein export ATPase FliI [Alphaproteobacteria bacterium]|nr:flagellar protein export ATPase FliI [Alphaproteobacteria bacterium]
MLWVARVESVAAELKHIPDYRLYGRVVAVQGLLVEVAGIEHSVSIGSNLALVTRDGRNVPGEVTGFRDDRALVMPFESLDGIGLGCRAIVVDHDPVAHPDASWLGRIVNALGRPVDGRGPLKMGPTPQALKACPPLASARQRVAGKLDLGVRAINTFLTCCRGQRMGIFSGSGIGKSILMSMMARFTQSDVNVIGLVGERGREVKEFIEDYLGPEGMKRTVIVVATSDESALMRRQAGYLTLTVAEYFSDLGLDVLCMIDSVTRFAMAQREIGLSSGEPPASKGYTPTVFSEMPRLLERAGPGTGQGTITGIFTVLVEGDDHNEPIADAVRGILDGHIVLDRAIAERGRYPAINVLRSVSRTMPACNSPEENRLVGRARAMIAVYEDMAEMIRLGAYRIGSDAKIDEAIRYRDQLEAFLGQDKDEACSLDQGYATLAAVIAEKPAPAVRK